jgi:hypothetical protein
VSPAKERIPPKTDRCGPTGKRRFRSAAAAAIALEIAQANAADPHDRRAPRRREQRAYECAYCGGWHLTSMKE